MTEKVKVTALVTRWGIDGFLTQDGRFMRVDFTSRTRPFEPNPYRTIWTVTCTYRGGHDAWDTDYSYVVVAEADAEGHIVQITETLHDEQKRWFD